jgi:hypothetical protein
MVAPDAGQPTVGVGSGLVSGTSCFVPLAVEFDQPETNAQSLLPSASRK